jgi:hypothetical protein
MTLTAVLILLALLTASAVGTGWVIHTYHRETRYRRHATPLSRDVDATMVGQHPTGADRLPTGHAATPPGYARPKG